MTGATAGQPASTFTAAKRGDLVVIGTHHHDYYIGQPDRERDTYEVCLVTGISRDGIVRKVRDSWGSETALRPDARRTTTLVPQARIDAAAAYAATRERKYPGRSQPEPYGSLDEVREALRPFLVR